MNVSDDWLAIKRLTFDNDFFLNFNGLENHPNDFDFKSLGCQRF